MHGLHSYSMVKRRTLGTCSSLRISIDYAVLGAVCNGLESLNDAVYTHQSSFDKSHLGKGSDASIPQLCYLLFVLGQNRAVQM
jgi:hypothetical protein